MENRDKIWMPSMREYRALSEGTAIAGGHLVPPEHSRTWLDYLRERSVLLAAGPNILPARSDSLHVPKLTRSVSVNMVAENAQIPASDPTFGELLLEPKAAAFTLASRQVFDDSQPELRQVLAADFMAAIAFKLDQQFTRGDGAGENMTGLRNQSGVTVTSLGANGVAVEIDHILDGLGRLRAAVPVHVLLCSSLSGRSTPCSRRRTRPTNT